MRLKSGLTKRVKAGIALIFFKRNARIMVCGHCGSTFIVPISNSIEEPYSDDKRKIDQYYAQYSLCKSCGAVCYEIQTWNYSGNIDELGFHKTQDSELKEK